MSSYWVLVADGSRARFFRGKSPNAELEEFRDLVNEDARVQEQELTSDKPGRFHDDQGEHQPGAPRSSTESSAREQSIDDFANDIADFLDHESSQEEFTHLAVIAEPKLLGRLRKSVASQTSKKILEEITKNLTKSDEKTIRQQLERLPSGFK